jgi:flagellar motor switch protein FliM
MNAIPYDFRKPARMPVEWHQRLGAWFQSAAVQANRDWSKQLATPLEVSVSALDTDYAREGLARLPANTLAYRVMIAGGQVPTFLVLPRLLIFQIIAVLLGDDAAACSDRELTLVEDNLADYFLVNLWLPYFRESWPGAQLVSWELGERETNPQASRFYKPAEVLLTLPWQLKGPWGTTEGLWFFPKKGLLAALADAAAPPPAPPDEKIIAARRQALVGNLPVLVEFELGTIELKLSQLSRLQVGDVVLLDQRGDEGVCAGAGNQKLFRGRVGRVGSWKAFRIEALIGQ